MATKHFCDRCACEIKTFKGARGLSAVTDVEDWECNGSHAEDWLLCVSCYRVVLKALGPMNADRH